MQGAKKNPRNARGLTYRGHLSRFELARLQQGQPLKSTPRGPASKESREARRGRIDASHVPALNRTGVIGGMRKPRPSMRMRRVNHAVPDVVDPVPEDVPVVEPEFVPVVEPEFVLVSEAEMFDELLGITGSFPAKICLTLLSM